MKGLSYQNGVLFIGEKTVGWAYVKNNHPVSVTLPLKASSLFIIGKRVFLAMPLWYKLLCFLWGAGILLSFAGSHIAGWPQVFPIYTVIYLLFGTHFLFPGELKKFHGAEHKVFSFKGIKSRRNVSRIKKAAITNRYCSTNTVFLYFFMLLLFIPIVSMWLPISQAVMVVSYGAAPAAPLFHWGIQKSKMTPLRKLLLQASYGLQRHITCSQPERIHVLTAVEAYRALAKAEYPHLLRNNPLRSEKKEEKCMAIIDLTVVPIGTESTSMSEDIAEIQKVLDKHEEKISYNLTSMSTIIEGELKDLFPIVEELHEIPFHRGAKRVNTNIRIDDRRDEENGMRKKVSSVERKM